MPNQISIFYTTIDSLDKAEQLAQQVIATKKAVCANIISSGKSIYWWNDKIEQGEECYILFKTTDDLAQELEEVISDHHPYDTPAIIHFDANCSDGFFDYMTSISRNK